MPLIRNLLLIVIFLAAAIGGTLYYLTELRPQHASNAIAATAPEAIPTPIFLALDPFTVTLNDDKGAHILYLELTLRVNDRFSYQQLQQYMPEVRNRALTELAHYKPGPVQTPDGRTQLAQALKRSFTASYHPQLPRPAIDRVLFTAFVVQ